MAAQPTVTRQAALEALARVREGELGDRALDAATEGLDPRDRAWTQELVYGTFRLQGRLDHIVDTFARDGAASLDPTVLDVLRLGAYQLLEMGSVPAYAAVSESVELVRMAGVPRASGLVNGILQNLRRRPEIVYPSFDDEPAAFLCTWGSHPRWLVEKWIERWGPAQARVLVEANNRRPELYIRPLGVSTDEARARLRAAEIESAPVDFAPDSLHVPVAPVAEVLTAVPAVVQDPAAALVVHYADVEQGGTVLDVCAAPGGKALGLAERAGRVVAADLSRRRMRRVTQNSTRLGWDDRIGVVVADARQPPFRPADAVLLDAPCTGTGTLRRHPDGRWRVTPHDLEALVRLQDELLAASAELVRPGGLLVYSTCSLEREENELRVEQFLGARPGWALEATNAVDGSVLDESGRLCVLPQRHGVDGAFAARLRRAA
jgi:16S rRNA (cytosine967-C5)-methyltransferase